MELLLSVSIQIDYNMYIISPIEHGSNLNFPNKNSFICIYIYIYRERERDISVIKMFDCMLLKLVKNAQTVYTLYFWESYTRRRQRRLKSRGPSCTTTWPREPDWKHGRNRRKKTRPVQAPTKKRRRARTKRKKEKQKREDRADEGEQGEVARAEDPQ